ncbi:MAG TPA: methyltransferase domain-containing protein [Patescibacteria group bacterium]|nr:methyltransferase domain-containing protein [Patescibacteria group bacterium]
MDAEKFHDHYLLQAKWLAPGRHWLYRKIGLAGHERILDFGCGSGVLTEEIRQICGRPVAAVDKDPEILEFARGKFPKNNYRIGNENDLLREKQRFDLIVLSFVLMWQHRPLHFLEKIKKLLDRGGTLLILAEPDYGGRIDYPPKLDFLKEIFSRHILQSGGDPYLGRKLKSLLQKTGFRSEVGLSSCLNYPESYQLDVWGREWNFWQQLAGLNEQILKKIRRLEITATRRQERLVVFPVFYAIAGSL